MVRKILLKGIKISRTDLFLSIETILIIKRMVLIRVIKVTVSLITNLED
jgi:hypothetical protein